MWDQLPRSDAMQGNRALLISSLAAVGLHLAFFHFALATHKAGIADFGHTRQSSFIRLIEIAPPSASKSETTEELATENSPLNGRLPFQSDRRSDDTPVKAAHLLGGLQYSLLDYIPREFLNFVPKPLAEIEIPFPATITGEVTVHLQLALFIDENGVVTEVQVDDSQLPAEIENTAVNAFLNARFKPGEINGLVVRSLLRVEVTFESHNADQTGKIRKPSLSM
jgi:hypothetical protein